MLISCKCLNFIATSVQQQQQKNVANNNNNNNINGNTATADNVGAHMSPSTAPAPVYGVDTNNSNSNSPPLAAAMMHIFLQKYPRNFIFYSQSMDFFKQAIGPICDLSINAINQRDLIYSLTLDLAGAGIAALGGSWQLSFCINCNTALCAKRLQASGCGGIGSSAQYLINCALLTSNEELSQRRADKSFSETFGLLIIDHPQLEQQVQNGSSITASTSSLSIGSMSTLAPVDIKHQRLRQLQAQQQVRLKREIAETDERIQRYTEQQFALLKSFREKSEQEYALLGRLIQQVPDQQATEWLDRTPPALEVNGGAINSYASRRRNTISSRRELNMNTPTTPTNVQPPNILALPMSSSSSSSVSVTSSINQSSVITSAIAAIPTSTLVPAQQPQQTQAPTNLTATIVSGGVARKLTNFDTPPATPEATPMSIGNSPTFRQQQQNQQQQQPQYGLAPLQTTSTASFQQQFPTPTTENADDCLFELEDDDAQMPMQNNNYQQQQHHLRTILQNPHHHASQYQRLLSLQQQQQHESNMSDLDESDAAEEAEDALDLDGSMPIPMQRAGQRATPAQILNFAKSLPIEIANSPMAADRSYVPHRDDVVEDDLDNTVDIAASIKALAKSVHGEAVFGDLPRPRLRSQI